MSLKDEIDKLIQAERKKLKVKDQADEEHHERQRRRFTTMHAVLREIAESIDTQYLEARLDDSRATIKVGKKTRETYWETDIRWLIEPNWGLGGEIGTFEVRPGFRVEETEYFKYPEREILEETRTFKSESEVAEYLLPKIAEKVAFYRHLEDRSKKQ